MTKVVLDANQYVSSLLKLHSNPAKIVRLVSEGDLTLLLSPAILDELERGLAYPRSKSSTAAPWKTSNGFWDVGENRSHDPWAIECFRHR